MMEYLLYLLFQPITRRRLKFFRLSLFGTYIPPSRKLLVLIVEVDDFRPVVGVAPLLF